MAKWFKYLFSEIGDKTAVPNTTDPAGYVSYQNGYGIDYERVLGTDPLAKAIERQKMNQLLYDVTSALQQYQTHGFPEYIDATANGGTAYAYAVNAIVKFTDGKNYLNTVEGNTNAPNISGWVLHNDIASTVHASTLKTTPVGADELGLIDSASGNALKKLTWADLESAIGSIGVNQSWVQFTVGTDRVENVNYLNSTGKPIYVLWWCHGNISSSGMYATYYINDIAVGRSNLVDGNVSVWYNYSQTCGFIVPNGDSYRVVVTGGSVITWSELR